MAIKRMMIAGQRLAVDDATGELIVRVSGLTLDPSVDIGDVNLLDAAGTKINPATREGLSQLHDAIGFPSQAGEAMTAAEYIAMVLASQAATTPIIISAGTAGNGALADVGQPVPVSGRGLISVTVKNTSDTAMTNFAVLVQDHQAADWITVLSGADWSATDLPWLVRSGLSATGKRVNTLAAGEAVSLHLNLGVPASIKFQAASSAADKSLSIYGSAGGR